MDRPPATPPFAVRELLHVGVASSQPEALAAFIERVLGLPVAERAADGTAYVRCDGYDHRLAIVPSARTGLAYIDLLLADDWELERAAAWLAEQGVPYREGTRAECVARRVAGFLELADPEGRAVALCYGPLWQGTRVAFPRAWSALGLGHVGLKCRDPRSVYRFYRDVLGFRLSDQVGMESAYFVHCADAKHHSVAILPWGPAARHELDHVMFEVPSLDDVMMAYYALLAEAPDRTQRPVRHPPSNTISVYVIGPDGYRLELGFGHRRVDPATHVARTLAPAAFADYWGGRATDPVQAP